MFYLPISAIETVPVAPVAVPSPYGFGSLLIWIVIVAACVALVFVALKQFGIAVPGWVVHVAWIVGCAFLIILAIRLVLSM